MNVTEIPFVKDLNITQKSEDILILEANEFLHNHINTVHASAQFTLAETQSGLYLQRLFPHLVGEVVPLLRSSSVKYKAPTKKNIYAIATVSQESEEKFENGFSKKGRGSIEVKVEVRDDDEVLTMVGVFVWFVQKIEIL